MVTQACHSCSSTLRSVEGHGQPRGGWGWACAGCTAACLTDCMDECHLCWLSDQVVLPPTGHQMHYIACRAHNSHGCDHRSMLSTTTEDGGMILWLWFMIVMCYYTIRFRIEIRFYFTNLEKKKRMISNLLSPATQTFKITQRQLKALIRYFSGKKKKRMTWIDHTCKDLLTWIGTGSVHHL